MQHKKLKKIFPVLCSLIICFSSFSVCAAESEDTIYSTSTVTLVCSSSEFEQINTVPTFLKSYMSSPAYSYSVANGSEALKIKFDFDFLDLDISSYKNYKIDFPLVLALISNRISFDSLNIYFHIVYDDGSTSEYIANPDSFENIGTSTRAIYNTPLSFVISGNKLKNIKESYFLIDCSSSITSRCYFGLRSDSMFTVSKYSLDYNPFFNSSLNWVSDILNFVTNHFALTIICIGFPVVAFAFILLKRLVWS